MWPDWAIYFKLFATNFHLKECRLFVISILKNITFLVRIAVPTFWGNFGKNCQFFISASGHTVLKLFFWLPFDACERYKDFETKTTEANLIRNFLVPRVANYSTQKVSTFDWLLYDEFKPIWVHYFNAENVGTVLVKLRHCALQKNDLTLRWMNGLAIQQVNWS